MLARNFTQIYNVFAGPVNLAEHKEVRGRDESSVPVLLQFPPPFFSSNGFSPLSLVSPEMKEGET